MISQIIFEQSNCLYLVINNHGLFSMRYNMSNLLSDNNNHKDRRVIKEIEEPTYATHVKFDQNSEVIGNNWFARNTLGFAYIEKKLVQLELNQVQFKNQIRFISYFAMEDSKSLGTAEISID